MNLLLLHKIFVWTFLSIYLLKFIFMLGKSKSNRKQFTQLVRIPEMVVGTGFLATGVFLFIAKGEINWFQVAKLLCVVISIPIAVRGFRKKNSIVVFYSILFLIMAYGLAEMGRGKEGINFNKEVVVDRHKIPDGKPIYAQYCVSCHGEDGQKCYNGAANLKTSKMGAQAVYDIIHDGRGNMPSFNGPLTMVQIKGVSDYVMLLQN